MQVKAAFEEEISRKGSFTRGKGHYVLDMQVQIAMVLVTSHFFQCVEVPHLTALLPELLIAICCVGGRKSIIFVFALLLVQALFEEVVPKLLRVIPKGPGVPNFWRQIKHEAAAAGLDWNSRYTGT